MWEFLIKLYHICQIQYEFSTNTPIFIHTTKIVYIAPVTICVHL